METEEGTTTASKITGLLEDVYETLRMDTPDLPPVFFKLDHGRRMGSQVWGHFAPNAWTADGAPRHEVMIASECLAAGAHQVLQTLIHEAVHALAEEREIRETSRQGRYHNRKFVTLAEELGLTYDAPRNKNAKGKLVPDERIGYSHVVLTEATLEKYAELLVWLEAEITAYRGNGKFTPAPIKRVTHAYAIFATPEGGLNVIQMGTTKYAKLVTYLAPHTLILSEGTQADLEGWIEDSLGLPTQDEGTTFRAAGAPYCGDHGSIFPEFFSLEG
jgi:hypothetical protein